MKQMYHVFRDVKRSLNFEKNEFNITTCMFAHVAYGSTRLMYSPLQHSAVMLNKLRHWTCDYDILNSTPESNLSTTVSRKDSKQLVHTMHVFRHQAVVYKSELTKWHCSVADNVNVHLVESNASLHRDQVQP